MYWKCPKCGNDKIVEVCNGAKVFSEIVFVGDEIEHGDIRIEDCDFVGYECGNCGYRLPATCESGLLDYLEYQRICDIIQ